jgi:hypothetical protein
MHMKYEFDILSKVRLTQTVKNLTDLRINYS